MDEPKTKKIKGIVTGFDPLTPIGEREVNVTCGRCHQDTKVKMQIGQKANGDKRPMPSSVFTFKCVHCGFAPFEGM